MIIGTLGMIIRDRHGAVGTVTRIGEILPGGSLV